VDCGTVSLLLVLLGGAVGAVARYLVTLWTQTPIMGRFPWGTLVANVVGSFVLGVISGLAAGADGLPEWVRLLAGTGFCGALTTYSTFGLETVRLSQAGAWRYASINAGATVVAGVIACWWGWSISN
jgi:fluoride exporter